jgi:hypothetical protein
VGTVVVAEMSMSLVGYVVGPGDRVEALHALTDPDVVRATG